MIGMPLDIQKLFSPSLARLWFTALAIIRSVKVEDFPIPFIKSISDFGRGPPPGRFMGETTFSPRLILVGVDCRRRASEAGRGLG